MKRVVIVGGGFGGLYAARALAETPFEVVVVDRRNHHLFQPLLYQVATATLNPSDIAVPIRHILRDNPRARVLLGEVTGVDTERRRVLLEDADALDYDYLILATGATHSYFGNPEWARAAPGLKTIEDALEIRRRIFLAFEAAEREPEPAARRAWMTFVIIGGGPTGVEMAGAVAEIARKSLEGDFRAIDPKQARIVLVEGLPRILPAYDESLSAKAQRRLERLGVEVLTEARVTGIDERGVNIGADRIDARTVVWAAGVQASPIARSLGVPLDRAGRVMVNRDLSVPGHPEIYVVGDLAHFEQDGRMVPGVSPAAMQGARHAAANIRRMNIGEPTEPFRYFDKGSFAVIGRGAAVGEMFGKLKISGLIAWFAWLFIHIFYLVGFRNRLVVMIDWAFSYLAFRRGARLITGEGAESFPRLLRSTRTTDGHNEKPALKAATARRELPESRPT